VLRAKHVTSDTDEVALRIAAEDRFALFEVAQKKTLAPHPLIVGNVADCTKLLDAWRVVWDLRRWVGTVPNDVIDALALGASAGPEARSTILVRPGRRDEVEAALEPVVRPYSLNILELRAKALPRRAVDLSPFADEAWASNLWDAGGDWPRILDIDPELMARFSEEEEAFWSRLDEAELRMGFLMSQLAVPELEAEEDWISRFAAEDSLPLSEEIRRQRAKRLGLQLDRAAARAALNEFVLHVDEQGEIRVVPHHAHSLHHVAVRGDEAMEMRPARVSARVWKTFRRAILRLEQLLNDPSVKERQIEQMLVENPDFFYRLNYVDIYPQVVLPRVDKPDLRPDVIAEPVGGEWADIIELKLPIDPILVRRGGRPQIAAALTAAAAQLREYHDYFEDRKLAARIESSLGIRCYRPKLVVIIGRDPNRFTAEEQRWALTADPKLEFITYDHLLRVARSRPLL
jgi:Domain of unknown function (DUF4263)